MELESNSFSVCNTPQMENEQNKQFSFNLKMNRCENKHIMAKINCRYGQECSHFKRVNSKKNEEFSPNKINDGANNETNNERDDGANDERVSNYDSHNEQIDINHCERFSHNFETLFCSSATKSIMKKTIWSNTCCWHAKFSFDKNKERISFQKQNHESGSDCGMRICDSGEKCFHYVGLAKGGFLFPSDTRLQRSFDHCKNFVHRKSKNEVYYSEILAHIKNRNNNKICDILSKEDFNINWFPNNIIEKERYQDDFRIAMNEAGIYSVLGKICSNCDFDTFCVAFNLPGVIINKYTLFQAIMKKDIKYIDLIGKENFKSFPKLNIPFAYTDPRIHGDYRNTIDFINVSVMLKNPDFSEIMERFNEWGIYQN